MERADTETRSAPRGRGSTRSSVVVVPPSPPSPRSDALDGGAFGYPGGTPAPLLRERWGRRDVGRAARLLVLKPFLDDVVGRLDAHQPQQALTGVHKAVGGSGPDDDDVACAYVGPFPIYREGGGPLLDEERLVVGMAMKRRPREGVESRRMRSRRRGRGPRSGRRSRNPGGPRQRDSAACCGMLACDFGHGRAPGQVTKLNASAFDWRA
jgi:hypothetical protein